jgi:hypothetical protein
MTLGLPTPNQWSLYVKLRTVCGATCKAMQGSKSIIESIEKAQVIQAIVEEQNKK